jgi:ABC-2 type transport system permease protein
VVVYVYNFSVLPLERSPLPLDFLQNEIAFFNIGLAGFVVSAISVRFIFPSVSSEGGAFWILRCSPLTLRRFMWGKFALYVPPMLILGEVLIIMTNYLLHVSPFMMVLSVVTMFLAVFGIVGLGIGFGALYPNFNFQNVAQVSTGFGGLIFMIYSALYIAVTIALEAGPVYLISMSGVKGAALSGFEWSFIVASFLGVVVLNLFVVWRPMKMGLKALTNLE